MRREERESTASAGQCAAELREVEGEFGGEERKSAASASATVVMAGLVPAISLRWVRLCRSGRDRRVSSAMAS